MKTILPPPTRRSNRNHRNERGFTQAGWLTIHLLAAV